MNELPDHSALEKQMKGWTPKCPSPDDMIALVKEKIQHPDALALVSHIKDCPFCLRAYTETRLLLNHAEETSRNSVGVSASKTTVTSSWHGPPFLKIATGLSFSAAAALLLFTISAERSFRNELAQKDHLLLASREETKRQAEKQQRHIELLASDNKRLAASIKIASRQPETSVEQEAIAAQDHVLRTGKCETTSGFSVMKEIHPQTAGSENEIEWLSPPTPRATFLLDSNVTLRWKPVSGADAYKLSLLDEKKNKPLGKPITIKANGDQPLERRFRIPENTLCSAQVQVSVWKQGAEPQDVNCYRITFALLPAETIQRLQQAKQQKTPPLAMGILYAKAGAMDAAEREFRSILSSHASPSDNGSAWAQKLLKNLDEERGLLR